MYVKQILTQKSVRANIKGTNDWSYFTTILRTKSKKKENSALTKSAQLTGALGADVQSISEVKLPMMARPKGRGAEETGSSIWELGWQF